MRSRGDLAADGRSEPEEEEEEEEKTEFISDEGPIVEAVISLLSNARSRIDAVGNQDAPSLIVNIEEYWNALSALLPSIDGGENRRIKGRYITDITLQNLEACMKLINDLHIDLRHLEGVRFNILISENEFAIDLSRPHPMAPATLFLYSNSKELLAQQEQLFETLWSRATPARQRIREIEEGLPSYETKVVRDPGEMFEETKRIILTSTRFSVSSFPEDLLRAFDSAFDQFKTVLERKQRGEHEGVRWLTTIDAGCVNAVKKFLELGMSIRHVSRIPPESFGLSEREVGVFVSLTDRGTLHASALFSNDPAYFEHYALIFEELWASGVDAQQRIKEILEGVEEPKIIILRNRQQVQSRLLQMINDARREVLFLLPTTSSFASLRKIGAIDALQNAASEREVMVSVLAPGLDARDEIHRFNLARGVNAGRNRGGNLIKLKSIAEATTQNAVVVLVVDRTRSFIVELGDDSQTDFVKANGVATYSTRDSTVKASVRFFERMWEDEELLERERRSRREAELLQDILAHDLRNYNQISKTSAELLKTAEESRLSEAQRAMLINNILKAVNRSSDLIERAKKLGKIVSQERVELRPLNLEDILRKSVDVVVKANAERTIEILYFLRPGARVLADGLLEEVFTNILSNSVKYTEKDRVRIKIRVEEAISMEEDRPVERFWKVTLTDKGRGIPDSLKDKLFTRYLDSAQGSGLGLSIVHALVVERYSGRLRVSDRAKGNHKLGTVIEVCLPAAT